ncbi:hypothetical protein [Helicobacter sp.]|uniref:hypothetical protein n=1 Tax=Helicobacter sp. TaxID=218 RepID=UPI0025C35994|nr:hypothetical protein [Helicobacter sp.]MCI5969043.1 hypothetical protein [Helicobacter sp.]MDY2585339.1 hypothetical protein [Helicobacter sp.]
MKKSITLDIFNEKGESLGKKKFYTTLDNKKSINQWIKRYDDKSNFRTGLLDTRGNDFQNQQYINIKSQDFIITAHSTGFYLTPNNLIPMAIYFSVRYCIKATWINNGDQFYRPNKKWEKDIEFQNDCLAFMLFHGKNRITAKEGINHFIPFSELEINAQEAFSSHFMLDFIQGKIKLQNYKKLESKTTQHKQTTINFSNQTPPAKTDSNFIPTKPLIFSKEAQAVLNAGKVLFKHYHTQTKDSKTYNANAALYDIKAHFQGFSSNSKSKPKMNLPKKAKDEAYKDKLGNLNYALKDLAKKLESKVYEYEFLLP